MAEPQHSADKDLFCPKCGHSWLAHEVGAGQDGEGCHYSFRGRCGCRATPAERSNDD